MFGIKLSFRQTFESRENKALRLREMEVARKAQEKYLKERAIEIKREKELAARSKWDKENYTIVDGEKVRLYDFETNWRLSRIVRKRRTVEMSHGLSYTSDTYGVWRDRFAATVPESIHNILEARIYRGKEGVNPWFDATGLVYYDGL